jgi:hypothetical protein
MVSGLLDGIFFEEHGDEGGGGDGDERADDAGERSAEKKGDENGEAHEIDAGTHDARGEDGVFDVDVDGIEDEDAGHFGPGVERGDSGSDDDGDDAAGDGDDVEEPHEEAEEDEVADVKESEDDGAGDSEDEHEGALAEEPFADFVFGFFEGAVETGALWEREEGEEEVVGVFALKHEVDAEKGCGEDVEDVREPEGERGEEIAGGGVESSAGALGEGVEAELVGQGELFDAGDDGGDALGKVGGEVAEIAKDGRKAEGEEESKDRGDGDDEKDNGNGAGGLIAADVEAADAVDGGHEHDSEESADVEDEELLLEGPGESEQEEDGDGKEDVAADFGAGALFVGSEVVGCGDGQLGISLGADCWMQVVCAFGG